MTVDELRKLLADQPGDRAVRITDEIGDVYPVERVEVMRMTGEWTADDPNDPGRWRGLDLASYPLLVVIR